MNAPLRPHRGLHRLLDRLIALIRHERSALAVVVWCMVIFAGLAIAVVIAESRLLTVDQGVQDSVMGVRSRWLDSLMVVLTFLGTRWAVAIIAGGLIIWSVLTGKNRALVAVIVGAALVNPVFEVGFKELVDRVRPDVARLVPGNGPSFPSGHVVASAGFYGMLPFLAWEASRSRLTQLAALIGSLGVILIVAVSRVYLDVHWTTDVIAGLLLGTVLVVGSIHFYLEWRGVESIVPIGDPVPAAAAASTDY